MSNTPSCPITLPAALPEGPTEPILTQVAPLRKPRRGDIDPDTGLVFWMKAEWVPPEKFARLKEQTYRSFKKWATKNRGKLIELRRARDRRLTPEQRTERYRRAVQLRGHEKVAADIIKWRKKNPEKVRAYNKKYTQKSHAVARAAQKRRRERDPEYRILCQCRSRLRCALTRQGERKQASTHSLLGCTIAELKQHLSNQFRPGMSWENYGPVWHIDHIRPCASFDLSDPTQLKQCFHFSNLQPLFALENIKKGARYSKVGYDPESV